MQKGLTGSGAFAGAPATRIGVPSQLKTPGCREALPAIGKWMGVGCRLAAVCIKRRLRLDRQRRRLPALWAVALNDPNGEIGVSTQVSAISAYALRLGRGKPVAVFI